LQHKPIKKIFVCEFITGGGLCGEQLPDSLAKEGALMRDALLRDLSSLPYRVTTCIDARLSRPEHCNECIVVNAGDNVWQLWQAQIKLADAVFLIAPETDGMLHYLTQIAALESALVLGCGLFSIEISSEKLLTYLALQQADILTLPTYTFENWPKGAGPWLAKPNDGVGCAETVCYDDAEDLMHWLIENKKQLTHVIQPYQTGTSASISCVMYRGRAHLLSCNTQIIDINNHALSYKGGVINGMKTHWQALELLANKIAATLPDLAGYVGIDVIVNDGEIFVVEINPRLTTSYVGLRAATGANPAELIINTLTQPDFIWPSLQQNQVEIHV
jgi:predicted ATP-grasp superfamily ATP-dependent carboligase